LKGTVNELGTGRTRISEACIGASVTLRRITNLEITKEWGW